jgi:hypothetical protein
MFDRIRDEESREIDSIYLSADITSHFTNATDCRHQNNGTFFGCRMPFSNQFGIFGQYKFNLPKPQRCTDRQRIIPDLIENDTVCDTAIVLCVGSDAGLARSIFNRCVKFAAQFDF